MVGGLLSLALLAIDLGRLRATRHFVADENVVES